MLRRTLTLLVAVGLLPMVTASAEEAPLCFGEAATINGHGQDVVSGTHGRDVIIYGNEVYGGGGDDLICTFKGFDDIHGGPGDDRINGGENQDVVDGGPGDDEMIAGGAGYLEVPGGETVSFKSAPGPVTVNLLTGVATGYGTDRVVGSEIIGSDYDDTLIAGDAWNANVIMGEGGNDIIHGNGISSEDQEDFLAGGDGNDQLYGKGSALLIGDAGDDLLRGGPVTYDPAGWLHHPGASAGITVRLGAGTVTGQGNDTLVNIIGLTATPYDDVLLGDGGPNRLSGGSGNDVIRGWRGADYLVGGGYWDDAENGIDALYGGAGPDHLSVYDEDGVRGGDRVDGQRGHDVCARNRYDTVLRCERP